MGNQLGESYFAINMSGAIIPVYSPDKWPSKVQIGVLNKKERCVVIQDGPIVRKIKFLNSAGSFVDGILDMNAPIKDWNDYVFHDISPHFKTDKEIVVYNVNGIKTGTYPAGYRVVPYLTSNGNTIPGTKNPHLMKIMRIQGPEGWPFDMGNDYGGFVETGIRANSLNTRVYGNWN